MRPTAATSHKTVSLPNLLFFFTLLRAGQSHHHETSDNRQILEVESLRDPSFTFVRVPSGHLDRSGRGLGKTSELPHATCAASALTLTFLHTLLSTEYLSFLPPIRRHSFANFLGLLQHRQGY